MTSLLHSAPLACPCTILSLPTSPALFLKKPPHHHSHHLHSNHTKLKTLSQMLPIVYIPGFQKIMNTMDIFSANIFPLFISCSLNLNISFKRAGSWSSWTALSQVPGQCLVHSKCVESFPKLGLILVHISSIHISLSRTQPDS